MNKDIYQLKIIYTDAGNKIEGMPYRIIQFHKDTHLLQFAQYILKNFSFKVSEPFGFYSDLKRWDKSEYAYELFEEDPKKNTLKNTFIDELFDIQKEYLLVYDYLEEYRFIIKYEKQVPERSVEYPELIESRGETLPSNEVPIHMEDDDNEPKYAAKKNTGALKDEFDDYDDDDIAKLEAIEGGEDDEEGGLGNSGDDDFDMEEFGGKEVDLEE